MEDNSLHKGMRNRLINLLKDKGIKDKKVLEAMNRTPRHLFLDSVFLEHAYENKAFPIGEGQTISHPYTVAFQTELLQIEKNHKILEIGTGSGYQCAVLCELSNFVYTIERIPELANNSKKLLQKMKYHPRFFCGDGTKGLPTYAPFDSILVTAGAPIIPQDLLDQLKVGGKLVIPIGNKDTQDMFLFEKIAENQITKKTFTNFAFVPLIGKNGWN